MRIVQLITRMDTIGGAQIHVSDLAVSLKKSGHEVYVMTGGSICVIDFLKVEEIPVIYNKNIIREINLIKDVKALKETIRILKEISPDLVAAHTSKAGIIGRIASWSLGIPCIYTPHGWSFTEGVSKKKRSLYILFEKLIGIISKGVINVSKYDEELALKHKVLPKGKMITIHNGVHDILPSQMAALKDEPPVLIMVARFDPPKTQLALLKILAKLQDIDWKLNLVGDGKQLEEAMEYSEERGLSDRVCFLGARTEIPDLLAQAQVFVLISNWEGLPLSILEAMRCGLPIIASDVGGVKEAVEDSVNGFLIPKDNEMELADKLSLLLTQPEMRVQMGKKSREVYENNFTFDQMKQKTVTYYKKIVNQTGR
ncbi:glycosyltransferase family 4 protein [Peribacillus glennii]|uniref:Glycosyltransferase family 1 protein n=1 Tax=Peribacillus glennii TaxID=2303991 RepID=A0A372LF15_9BACI|nr:glycosyltransferase family 4 protein [Peribacillus glennii]RFU64880.1 glycosyltransferase family 1 protein [Peribacillus glennii]